MTPGRALTAGALVTCLALLPAGAVRLPPALVEGGGIVEAGSSLCAHVPVPALIHVTLAPDPGAGIPIQSWEVAVEGVSAIGCPVLAPAVCDGAGSLSTGVSFENCAPEATGSLGAVVVCFPGPAYHPRPAAVGHATVQLGNKLGSFSGDVTLALAGEAVNEAANVCV